jgi:hypothetical protein
MDHFVVDGNTEPPPWELDSESRTEGTE